MTIILDFDDVLFDTARFKKTLARILKKHKIDFWKTYKKTKGTKGIYKISVKNIEQDIDKINFKEFLFPDVIKFLKTLRKSNDLILLSWGNEQFQKRKIYGLGQEFVSLFDKIITGPTEKAKVFKKILKSYKSRPVVFIDDKAKELQGIKDNFEDVILIKIDRSKGESLFKVWRINKIN